MSEQDRASASIPETV